METARGTAHARNGASYVCWSVRGLSPLLCHSSRTGSLPRLVFASLFNRDAFYSFILTVSRLFSSFYLFLILFLLFFYCSVVYCLYGGQFVRHPGHGLIFFVHFSLFAVNAWTRSRRRTTGFSFTQRSGLFKIVPVPAKSRWCTVSEQTIVVLDTYELFSRSWTTMHSTSVRMTDEYFSALKLLTCTTKKNGTTFSDLHYPCDSLQLHARFFSKQPRYVFVYWFIMDLTHC